MFSHTYLFHMTRTLPSSPLHVISEKLNDRQGLWHVEVGGLEGEVGVTVPFSFINPLSLHFLGRRV